ncbi:cytochrome c oxidase assembly factor CtaG [Blastococcus colisei]|uniref:Cytochrome c oxidase assembly factor CtaG n=1 Tax=Blastococcus colisei TaxID=1564162 RepID=A0A543PET1_9ACTN|nr:cytochrome c oxidase assembly protein [Blastococcus colisei]TQN42559.1 cytochrome c oxidase assembly factor CtaG [Blastococcus colisei]
MTGDRATGSVLAHVGGAAQDWPVLPLAFLALVALGYPCLLAWTAPRRRSPWTTVGPGVAWVFGIVALAAALASPIERLGEDYLLAHMVQHLLLTLVAAPLLVLADPVPRIIAALPEPVRPVVARPWARLVRGARRPAVVLVVAVLYLAVVLAWHLPAAYEAALLSTPVHIVEHLTFLAAALVFWWNVLRVPRRRLGQLVAGLVAVLIPALGEAVLGGAMLFSTTPWYDVYVGAAAEHGFDPVVDQQVAGALMWMAGMPVYLLAAVVLLWRVVRVGDTERQPPVPHVPDAPERVVPEARRASLEA